MTERERLCTNLALFSPFYDWDYRNFKADIPLLRRLTSETGGPVLEVGCGTGRILAELADIAGTVGIDISPEMLAQARCKLANGQFQHKPKLVLADMADFHLGESRFGLVVCVSNSLMHLANPGHQLAALRCFKRHLRRDGLLVLDLFNPPVAQIVSDDGALIQVDSWCSADGQETTKWMRRTVDWIRQIQYTEIVLSVMAANGQDREVKVDFNLRFLWPHELRLMLAASGFELVHLWGGYNQEFLHDDSETLLCVARSR